MRKVAIDDVDIEVSPLKVHSVRRPVSDALGTEHFAMNYFELEPGDRSRADSTRTTIRRRLFNPVRRGDVRRRRRTRHLTRRSRSPSAAARSSGSPRRVPDGVQRRAKREPVVGFAFGAPSSSHDFGEIESAIPCQECGEETGHGMALTDNGNFEFTCTQCGNSFGA